jgi:hypothetical protein
MTRRPTVLSAATALLERFPDAEFGSPGRLVQELPAIPGYLPCCVILFATSRRTDRVGALSTA